MNEIAVLDQQTIDKIAAGEVIERPASIVKELVENAVDAGANAVTVEIKDGGTSFIRITDNGSGIDPKMVPLAFLRHATSKIRTVEDLLSVHSLGFRGEALSSIAAVCQVELITRTPEELTGVHYFIEGGREKDCEEIGAPAGTTFLVRNIFFNTPARRKFLKSAQTEAGYVSDLMERMALANPKISFKFIAGGQTKLHTSGNHRLKDIIYNIYGREITSQLLEVSAQKDEIRLTGFIGKPMISRGNRNYENYFVNGRYIKSSVISRAIEDAYQSFMMKHKYPFTALHLEIPGELLDINVHPTKMELRFADNEGMYRFIYDAVRDTLTARELIPQVEIGKREREAQEKPVLPKSIPEPFEQKRLQKQNSYVQQAMERSVQAKEQILRDQPFFSAEKVSMPKEPQHTEPVKNIPETVPEKPAEEKKAQTETSENFVPYQEDFFTEKLLDPQHVKEHRIIGQVFSTYWLVEFRDQLYMIDQHAAHEKVLYERMRKTLSSRQYTSQYLNPPIILTLSMTEETLLKKYMDHFTSIGFEIEAFGGKEYALRAVPDNLFGIAKDELFLEMLDDLAAQPETAKTELIDDRIATMSCKAAVKGNHRMSEAEARALIDELMTLENPYHCPHGRPTIVMMSKYEMERKFKRVL
ncbi:MAG: DNA mismatch repair endonuclease MutL [Eubacteriales bacterium]|nr:DNA mismatch repair endonuclease MutL [Eubacteriales bacterium]